MNQNHKSILLFIFVVMAMLFSSFGFFMADKLNIQLVLLFALIVGFIIGGGYVRLLIEPLEKRSNELELLSRQTLHELNLPVATILANTQMLLKKEENEKNIKRLMRIEQASATLKTLYTELDYMIKKQIHKVELVECELQALIEQRVQTYEELFPQINFELTLEKSSVKIDTIGFLKVLDNLTHNAVKYSRPDSVVSFVLKEMQLSIKDEGIGMDEDFVFNAFEHYFQEDSQTSGQGIGLGLVKEYCDRNKISIYLDSKKDQGTTITLDLRSVRANN